MNDENSIEKAMRALRATRPDNQPIGASVRQLSNDSVLKLYDSIRREVEADDILGGRYRLVGEAAKERARLLQDELVRRGLSFTPIRWS